MWRQALLDFLRTIWPSIAGTLKLLMAGWVGRSLVQGNVAQDELGKLSEAAKARADVRLMSDADVVRELKERGLYRDGEPSADRQQ